MNRSVVVTGLGCVTPAGLDAPSTLAALRAGRSVARRIPEAVDSEVVCKIGAKVEGFPREWPRLRQNPSRMARAAQFALAAALEAAGDAGLERGMANSGRVGAIIGTGTGDSADHVQQARVAMDRGHRAIHPLYVPHVMSNAPAAHVSIELGLRGATFSTGSACASSAHAITLGLRLVGWGELDVVFAGGTDEMFSTLMQIAAFDALKVLSRRNGEPERACRPFDAGRDGLVLGEGAGVLVLEEEGHARRRGARIHARLLGAGMANDATHIVAPAEDGDGAVRAMEEALREAGRPPEDVGHVNAHGTSTSLNDRIEAAAIGRVFGKGGGRVCVNATKSVIGHTMGASAAIAAVATVAAVRDGVVHPTANYETPDPDCPLDVVAGVPREVPARLALVNAFGFGGHCVSLAFGRAD